MTTAHPQSIPEVQAAMLAWAPPPDLVEAYGEAIGAASPVVQAIQVYDLLRAQETIDPAGLALLAGCAFLIATNAWWGRGAEAIGVRDAALAALGEQ
jgi:hypothetical protein